MEYSLKNCGGGEIVVDANRMKNCGGGEIVVDANRG
jgi:hypothetical protein